MLHSVAVLRWQPEVPFRQESAAADTLHVPIQVQPN